MFSFSLSGSAESWVQSLAFSNFAHLKVFIWFQHLVLRTQAWFADFHSRVQRSNPPISRHSFAFRFVIVSVISIKLVAASLPVWSSEFWFLGHFLTNVERCSNPTSCRRPNSWTVVSQRLPKTQHLHRLDNSQQILRQAEQHCQEEESQGTSNSGFCPCLGLGCLQGMPE